LPTLKGIERGGILVEANVHAARLAMDVPRLHLVAIYIYTNIITVKTIFTPAQRQKLPNAGARAVGEVY
jgi:hypothetical protein